MKKIAAILLFAVLGCGGGSGEPVVSVTNDYAKINIVASDQTPLVFYSDSLPVEIVIQDQTITGEFGPEIDTAIEGFDQYPKVDIGKRAYLLGYGDYYLVAGDKFFKILLLPERFTVLQRAFAIFDFFTKNSLIGHAHDKLPVEDSFHAFFYSDEAVETLCGAATNLFNYIIEQALGLETRHVGYYGDIGEAYWGHSVSEIKIDDRWIFFDALLSITTGESLLDTYKSIQNGTVNFRHVVPKDLAAGYGYYFTNWYTPEKMQHVFYYPYFAPEQIPGLDYTYLDISGDYISLIEFSDTFY